jgi:hypothetical protein
MLHFIVEGFNLPLVAAVAFQRLLASLAGDLLREGLKDEKNRAAVRRDGDDIFVLDRKFSISIATVSPTSALIHFAVNCTNEGTPVPTASLGEFGIHPRVYAEELMMRFAREATTIREATMKVKWVQ